MRRGEKYREERISVMRPTRVSISRAAQLVVSHFRGINSPAFRLFLGFFVGNVFVTAA